MAPSDYIVVGGWLVGWMLFVRAPRLPRREEAAAEPEPVTVVIPARNEEETLPLLLADIAATRSPETRVVVVDDDSEDGTADVARAFPFVEVVKGAALEPGWIGKTWACHQGAARAGTGTLVFLDADVRMNGDALARVVDLRRRRGGLVTVWPHHHVHRLYEHLSAVPTLVTAMCVGSGSLFPPSRPRCGFGPLMGCSVEDYRATGGHSSIRGDVVDDFAFARLFADSGRSVTNVAGGDAVYFRMYPGGLKSFIEGWTKSLGRGVAGVQWWRLAGVMLWLTCALGGLTWAYGLPRPMSWIFLAMFTVQMAVQFRQVGTFGILDAVLYPVHVIVMGLLFFRSLWRTYVRRTVRWRGRDVPVRAKG